MNATTSSVAKKAGSNSDLAVLKSSQRVKRAIASLDEGAVTKLQEKLTRIFSDRVDELRKASEEQERKKALVDEMIQKLKEQGVSSSEIKTIIGN
ncbi:H-NS family histone-like protein [Vibrio gangliei]|uniref:H-NS family histone-like protein n=1 Tax=Vibrio gangliei TaxID=2077090 RepID=UPI000D018A59|nr:hypothetical protein [Vibrio gangliei]